jgi:predicted unusual protein kinase regulating ubiquinone biosynthesis (AarF/ABC1/UbiB family)
MTNKNNSNFKLIKLIIKLLPIIINFKRDRKEWVKREGKNIDENKYRKNAEKALKIFIQLGPSYIKLGQWLSSRSDILPQPYLEVFATLQDDVPVEPFEKVRKIIDKELGNLEENFDYFNKDAFSGASLGQVYHAKYNGKDVVVKVSRPEIERIVDEDISIIKKLIPLGTKFIDPNLRFSVEGMFSQFTETIYEEMDYLKEAQNLLTIKKNLSNEKKVIIPNVILDRTSKHIITTEYEPGIKVTDIETLDKKGIDRQKLVILIHHVFFKMLLRNNIFHSDPHPGNIAVKDDGSIILYDFGMVGRLDNETRLLLIRLYLGLIDKDPVRTVDVLYQLGTLDYNTNRNIIEKAIELSIRSMHGKHVDKMEVKSLMDLSNKTLSKFPFRLPKYLALYMRMTSIVEGIYNQHKIKFQFVKVLSNLFEQEGLIKEAYIEEIKQSFQKFVKNLEASANLSQTIKTYLDNKETNIKKTDRHYAFLGKSIFASALFVGSAFLFSYNPIFSYMGFICSIILFVFSIIKK